MSLYVTLATKLSSDSIDFNYVNQIKTNEDELESRKDTSYVQFTANVSITATVEASSTTIVTAGAVTANGTDTYEIEFFCPGVTFAATAGQTVTFSVFDGATQSGRLQNIQNPAAASFVAPGGAWAYRLVPTAASHTYSIRGFVSTGTVTAQAGAGGVGTNLPGYIRVRKVQ